MSAHGTDGGWLRRGARPRFVGLGFVFLWFFIGGIAHFAATDLEQSIVPPYVPWPQWLLVARLPLQAGLLILIAWCTRPYPANV